MAAAKAKSEPQNLQMTTLTPSGVRDALAASLAASVPVFLWGSPGIGKSDVVRQVAAQRGVELTDVRALLLDPVDLRGLPHVNGDGCAHWAPPVFLPLEGVEGPEEGILFLDELNAATPLVQASCFQLVLDRAMGEFKLKPGWHIVAAGNYESDRAVTHRMPTPLRSRMLHLNMIADNDEWARWMVEREKRPEVVAFVRFRPELLHNFNKDTQTFPCPRTWAKLSDLLDAEPSPGIEHAIYAGIVGEGAAVEFTAFLRTYRSLPDIDDILTRPAKAKVPDDPSAQYAVSSALGRRIDEANLANAITYLDRLPQEFSVFAVRDALRRPDMEKRLTRTAAFVKWSMKNQAVLL